GQGLCCWRWPPSYYGLATEFQPMPGPFSRNWMLSAALLAALAGNAQDPPASRPPAAAVVPPAVRIQPPPAGHHFPEGVTYHYKAEWRLLDAGTATLRVERGPHGEERITGVADSTGFVGRLYRIHDVFEAAFDPKTFCSQQIRKRTEEGSDLQGITSRKASLITTKRSGGCWMPARRRCVWSAGRMARNASPASPILPVLSAVSTASTMFLKLPSILRPFARSRSASVRKKV